MAESVNRAPTAQQLRKVQEAVTVQRLTTWIGAAALTLAGFLALVAAKALPMTIGVAQAAGPTPTPSAGSQVSGALDDRIVVRRVYVPPVRPPAGGVRAAQPAAPVSGVGAARVQAAAPAPAPAPAAAPAPKPVAATGGSTAPR